MTKGESPKVGGEEMGESWRESLNLWSVVFYNKWEIFKDRKLWEEKEEGKGGREEVNILGNR